MVKKLTIALALLLAATASPVSAGGGVDADEYEIKAAMYVNLLRLVDWPAGKPGDSASPFVVGVAGADEMAHALESVARSTGAPMARKLIVRRVSGTAGLAECHSVFVGPDRKKIQTILQALGHSPVLTVSEDDRFLAMGGMINLNLRNDTVQIEVNLEVAESAGLAISSRLLKIAAVKKGASK